MGEYGIGQPVRRKEDARLLMGKGRFSDDLIFDGQAFVHFLRSPHAHALIRSIDATLARAAPGVVAVFTAADLDGVGPLVCACDLVGRDGSALFNPRRALLADEEVRFLGELAAVVIAETASAAKDASELIAIDYDARAAVVSTGRALDPNAPAVWPGRGSNLALHWENRDPSGVDAVLMTAPRRVAVDLVNNRVAPCPIEPRAAAATYDAATDRMTLYAPSQGGRTVQEMLAVGILKVLPDQIRTVSYDTGGGFGVRAKTVPEFALLLWAARRLGRPVKWCADRSETFLSDYHGRDQVSHAEMGLDENGRILAVKIETILNLGAYVTEMGPRIPITGGGRIIPGAYDIDCFYFSVKSVFTHTTPTDTYRGAGAPEANFLMERLMDEAADACSLARDEVRRRNLIPMAKLPYRTQMNITIDSGDFVGTMDMNLKAADWTGFARRSRESEARGKLRGIGLCVFLEAAGARPAEEMRVRVEGDGSVKIFAGTYSHGQGHDTVYAQMLVDFLGANFNDVTVIQGDTETMPKHALGTFGSRSSLLGGVGIKRACEHIVAKGKLIAGHLMQTEPPKVSFGNGVFRAASTSVTLAEVAAAARDPRRLPDGLSPGLDHSYYLEEAVPNYPNGCHICEVEVDSETGTIEILAYTATEDCGVVLNPLIVHGQLSGGVVQGLGQALIENVVYDDSSGQMLTGSYMDYGMPRADHLPNLVAHFNAVSCRTNDLGVKGAGEGGTIAAPPALVSAVLDALKPLGVHHIDMPLTPEKVWRAIHARPAPSPPAYAIL